MLTKIVEASELEIPEEMIRGRAQILKNSLEGQLRNGGNTLQDYMDYNNLSPEQLEEYLTHDAVNMLKGQGRSPGDRQGRGNGVYRGGAERRAVSDGPEATR